MAALAATPPENEYDPKSAPNGTPTTRSLFFHPHIDLVSGELREVPPDDRRQVPPCAPHGVGRTVTAVAGGKLYLLGGLDDDGITGRVQVFDPRANAWSTGPDLPTPVFAAQGAAVGSEIYVLGGWSSGPGGKRALSAAVQVLDVERGRWRRAADLPIPVAEATAAAVDGKIHVVSGWSGRGRISETVQVLDTATGSWSEGAPASLPVVGASAVAVDERIYVIGGRVAGDQVTPRTTYYEAREGVWGVGPELAVGVMAAVAGRLGGRLYLVGGRDQVGGPALRTVQELDLGWEDGGRDHWRHGLPQPVPTAGSGGGSLGDTLFVVGGRVMTGRDPLPGRLTDLTQSYHSFTPWTLCGSRPVFTSSGVLNAAALVAVETPRLAPGARAVIVGDRFSDTGETRSQALGRIGVTVDGRPAPVFSVQRERVDFLVPPGVPVGGGTLEVAVEKEGSPMQAPPVDVPAAKSAPGLFTYTYGETREPTFLEPGPALACNGDGSLNFADQPASPGDHLVLYATGLGDDPDPAKVDARMGVDRRYKAKVVEVRPSPEYDGVHEIEVVVPSRTGFANNVLTVLRYAGDEANRIVVSVAETPSRLDPVVGCEVGKTFVFGPVGRSLIAYRPVEEADDDVDTQSNVAFWRHTGGTER